MQLVPSFFLEDKQIRRSQGLMSPIRNEKKYTEKENIMQFEQKILGAESWGTANCWSAEYTNSYRWQREKWHFHYQALDIYLGISQLAPPVISETITDGQSPGVWSKMIEVTCLTSEIKKLNNMCFNLFFFFSELPSTAKYAIWSSVFFHYWEANFTGINIGHAIANFWNS